MLVFNKRYNVIPFAMYSGDSITMTRLFPGRLEFLIVRQWPGREVIAEKLLGVAFFRISKAN